MCQRIRVVCANLNCKMPMGPYKFYPCGDKDKKGHEVSYEDMPKDLCHDCKEKLVTQASLPNSVLSALNRSEAGVVFPHVRRSL